MYYMFGAGTNSVRAVDYWQKKNIIAIVDNDPAKQNMEILSVPVISFEKFLEMYDGETVIITTNLKWKVVTEQLMEAGINNFYVAPFMQSYFWNPDEIYTRFRLEAYKEIFFMEKSPLTERLAQYVKEKNSLSEISYEGEKKTQNESASIAITFEGGKKDRCENYFKTIDILQEIENSKKEKFAYLNEYKDIYRGCRCFIIGNGPSLKIEDLDCLYHNKEISFGCNGIFNMFAYTKWRPNYYCIGDGIVYLKNKDSLPKNIPMFIRYMLSELKNNRMAICYSARGANETGNAKFSDDLVEGVYGGRSVTYDMLQIAAYMGFDKIYLLGVDFTSNGHFYKNILEDKLVVSSSCNMTRLEECYRAAENYSQLHNFRIYNATRGGALEVFERIDFDSLFK